MNFSIYYALFGALFVGGTVGFIVVTRGLRDLHRVYEPRPAAPAASPASSAATPQT
jgi:hypothetical protein